MTRSLQDEGHGGIGPSGIQCLKQNVRERRQPWPMCASAREEASRDFARAKPGSGGLRLPKGLEKEEQKRKNPPPVPGPWALHGQAALALGALARMPVEELALAARAEAAWEGRQRVRGPVLPPPPGSGSDPGEQNTQLWRTAVARGLGHSSSPTVSPRILPQLVLGHGSLWPRKASPSCPAQGHRQRGGPGWAWSTLCLHGCLAAKPDSLE